MYQMLLERFKHEMFKLETNLASNEVACFKTMPASCCHVSPQLFLTATGCDSSWLDLFRINDCTSFFFDMKILREILPVLLLGPEELQQVRSVSLIVLLVISVSYLWLVNFLKFFWRKIYIRNQIENKIISCRLFHVQYLCGRQILLYFQYNTIQT